MRLLNLDIRQTGPLLTEVPVVVRFAETGGEVVVTVSSVLTVERTGGLLTEPATGALGTVAGEGPDTGPAIVTGRMTEGLLTVGSSVASLAPADPRSHTAPSQPTARTTLGLLTLLSSPASLADTVIWRNRGTPFGVDTPASLACWRRFMFFLISLQFPDSLNVLRGEMSFPLACSTYTAGHNTAGPRLPLLSSVLDAVHHVAGVETAGPP